MPLFDLREPSRGGKRESQWRRPTVSHALQFCGTDVIAQAHTYTTCIRHHHHTCFSRNYNNYESSCQEEAKEENPRQSQSPDHPVPGFSSPSVESIVFSEMDTTLNV